jgi:hypothetical protein
VQKQGFEENMNELEPCHCGGQVRVIEAGTPEAISNNRVIFCDECTWEQATRGNLKP